MVFVALLKVKKCEKLVLDDLGLSYRSMSVSLLGVGGSWSGCGVAQPTRFLQYFLNQLLEATTMVSDDAGT